MSGICIHPALAYRWHWESVWDSGCLVYLQSLTCSNSEDIYLSSFTSETLDTRASLWPEDTICRDDQEDWYCERDCFFPGEDQSPEKEVKWSSSPCEGLCSLSSVFVRNSFWHFLGKHESGTMLQNLPFEIGDFQRRSFCLGNPWEIMILPVSHQAFSLGFLSLALLLRVLASMRNF